MKYAINQHQFNVCKYAMLTGTGIAEMRHNLVDAYNRPIFEGIPTSYLNRTTISNLKIALRSYQKNYQKNHNGGKSKYKPLPEKYSVYPDFRPTEGTGTYYPPLTPEQYQSQFVPPIQDEVYYYDNDDNNYYNYESTINMANSFSHLNHNRRVHLSPAQNPQPPPLPTGNMANEMVVLRTESQAGVPEATYAMRFNTTVHGVLCRFHVELSLKNEGLTTMLFPGGGGIQAYVGTGIFKVLNRKINALILNLYHSFPLNNAMVFESPAIVVSTDTVIVPIITGLCPAALADIAVEIRHHTSRLGESLDNVCDIFQAMKADCESRGSPTELMAITLRNLPRPLSTGPVLQDDDIRQLHPAGLTPAVSSKGYGCNDTLDQKKVDFNTTW
jgi:hypothetical protein